MERDRDGGLEEAEREEAVLWLWQVIGSTISSTCQFQLLEGPFDGIVNE